MDDSTVSEKLNQILANQAWAEEVLRALAKKVLEIQVTVAAHPGGLSPHEASAAALRAADEVRAAMRQLPACGIPED